MKNEYYKSSNFLIYIYIVFLLVLFWAGDFLERAPVDIFLFVAFGLFMLLVVSLVVTNTYVEIQGSRKLINSGYHTFKKDNLDILDIKYIYRFPNFIIKWYGSRMVFYAESHNGELRQSSLREINYSNDTLLYLLKRLKQIKPAIELDPEYEQFIKGKLYLENPSNNTVQSVEARLKAKGEKW